MIPAVPPPPQSWAARPTTHRAHLTPYEGGPTWEVIVHPATWDPDMETWETDYDTRAAQMATDVAADGPNVFLAQAAAAALLTAAGWQLEGDWAPHMNEVVAFLARRP